MGIGNVEAHKKYSPVDYDAIEAHKKFSPVDGLGK
jgi:hypothetical protein